MNFDRHLRVLLLTAGATGLCLGQAPTANPEQPSTTQACIATAAKPCPAEPRKPTAAERFPFPGTPSPAAGVEPPEAPVATPPDAAKAHPFPGTPAPTGSGSSSSSSSSSPDSFQPDPNAGPDTPDPAAPPRRRKLPKINAQSQEEREDEDLEVSRFYFGQGNYPAAYQRAKDAVKAQPEDPEGHLALAQAAQKLNKHDEAVAHFKLYLSLDPDGDKVKAARKALAGLN